MSRGEALRTFGETWLWWLVARSPVFASRITTSMNFDVSVREAIGSIFRRSGKCALSRMEISTPLHHILVDRLQLPNSVLLQAYARVQFQLLTTP